MTRKQVYMNAVNKGDQLDMANYMHREFACYQRKYNFNKRQKHHTGHQCIFKINCNVQQVMCSGKFIVAKIAAAQ
ncbi:hypothetical protein T4D_1235 [Trichinella pseudospiralis]|uniref:Uncharacterized protein n=1 Tax=Trichinella pseudospiralis TaxID=6337 RepID=A0A0V1G3L1_TRIPS|nr:hypothetical protein T4D_1235 [Trichinella pseudospiralis]